MAIEHEYELAPGVVLPNAYWRPCQISGTPTRMRFHFGVWRDYAHRESHPDEPLRIGLEVAITPVLDANAPNLIAQAYEAAKVHLPAGKDV